MERHGLFDVSVYKILDEDALRKETVFGCEVSIPGTSYRIREETMYFPGKGMYVADTPCRVVVIQESIIALIAIPQQKKS